MNHGLQTCNGTWALKTRRKHGQINIRVHDIYNINGEGGKYTNEQWVIKHEHGQENMVKHGLENRNENGLKTSIIWLQNMNMGYRADMNEA